MVEGEIGLRIWVYGYRSWSTWISRIIRRRTQSPIPRRLRGHSRKGGDAFRLPDSLEIGEEECTVFENRPAHGTTKLVALEWWYTSHRVVEIVPRIQCAVTQELVCSPVKPICSRARNGVDDATRGLAILGRVVAGDDRELLNGVDSEVPPQYAPGGAVGIIVEADAVQAIVVLLGTRTGDGQLLPKATITSIRSRCK